MYVMGINSVAYLPKAQDKTPIKRQANMAALNINRRLFLIASNAAMKNVLSPNSENKSPVKDDISPTLNDFYII